MNKRLKFSWGHIIAFLALIFIAYVTFMGITYQTCGDWIKAGIWSGICVIVLGGCFLGAQYLKSAPRKYYKNIKWERRLLILSPLVLLVAFYPFNHFWTILSHEDEIKRDFSNAIQQAHGIFDEYETYANERRGALDLSLQQLSDDEKANRDDELRLLLTSQNYEDLKKEANQWIDNAAQNPSVWNIFLLGNIGDIQKTVDKWTVELHNISSKHLSCETDVQDFNTDCPAKLKCIDGLNAVIKECSDVGFRWNTIAFVLIIVCWLLLMLPYYIQERNARNNEKFWDFWPFVSKKDVDNNDTEVYYIKKQKDINKHEYINKQEEKAEIKPRSNKGKPV